MITRNLAEVQVVHAFDQASYHSCTVAGFTSACGGQDTGGALPFSFTGRLIDRLALGRNFQAVALGLSAYGNVITSVSSCSIKYLGLAAGIQHSATTCSGGFVDYSTADWPPEIPLQAVTTATSTGDAYYTPIGASLAPVSAYVLSTAATTSTSTGYATYVGQSGTAIPLTAAQRFIRIVVAPHIETTGCGGSNMAVAASLVFGQPDVAPAGAQLGGGTFMGTPIGRVSVTSACST